MNNIITFPTERRQEQIDDEQDRVFENFTEECHYTAHFILLLIEDCITDISEDEVSAFEMMAFRDPNLAESRDASSNAISSIGASFFHMSNKISMFIICIISHFAVKVNLFIQFRNKYI